MAATTTTKHLLQHPSHHHTLELLLDLTNETRTSLFCVLCLRKIWTEAYTCQEGCDSYYYHRVCAEAPPQIDRHPLHPVHPLTLIQRKPAFRCDGCNEHFNSGDSSFRCDECDFDLDICCALSSLSDVGGSQGGKTSEQITLPIHPHTLTSFSTRHDFVGDSNCCICQGSVEGDGYMCLRRCCEFIIHNRCIQDLYYPDGTKAPRVYHGHPLEIFVGEGTGYRTCASCDSDDQSSEFIGCASCQVFYHRNCFQVPEILRYPSHNPDHTLVLFPNIGTQRLCQSCSSYMKDEIYYRCTSCEFFVHVGCVFQVLAYCEEGMSAKIKLSWHKHPLLLCHQTESASNGCIYCEDDSIGPSYVCEEEDCQFRLHKRCTEIESTITHPHHPDHPLTLCEIDDDDALVHNCKACAKTTDGLMFSCERCVVDLHVKCAAGFPTHKHCLHEHELLRFEEHLCSKCNRCGRWADSPLFRCVPCNFNLHEECMELPQVVKSKIHWHPLTLHETFVEDDSGEYYCEQCEKTRDPRLGAYVCGHCKLELPRIYHIECVLPELGKVYAKNKSLLPSVFEKLCEQIADKKEEVRAATEKQEELSRELHELVKQRSVMNAEIISWMKLTKKTAVEKLIEQIADKKEVLRAFKEKLEEATREVDELVKPRTRVSYSEHMECVLPELRKVYVKEDNTIAMERVADEITRREEQALATERKLGGMKRELEELRKKHAARQWH